MSKIEEFSKLSDAEFLSFLYSERSRYNEKRLSGGWTLWAIYGSIFALCVFVYQTIKGNALDYALCYYILSSFCPVVLFFVYFAERIRGLAHGDSKHIIRIREAAPILFLFYITVIYSVLLAIGLFLHISLLPFFAWALIFIPILISWGIIFFQKNVFVTSFDYFVIAKNNWVNGILIFLITGAIFLPTTASVKYLSFGFSVEFECAFSLVIVVALSYLLLLFYFARNYVAEIDNLIDAFIYKNWPKERIVKKLEFIFLGFRPNDLFQDQLLGIVEFINSIPNLQVRMNEIDKLTESEMSIEQICGCLQEIDKYCNLLDNCYKNYDELLDTVNDLLNLKTPLLDEDFVATLKMLVNSPQNIRDFQQNLKQIQSKLKTAILSLKNKSADFLCGAVNCPNRLNGGCSTACK